MVHTSPHTGDREEVSHTDLNSTHHVGTIAKPVADRRSAYVLQVWGVDFVPASAETLNEQRGFIVPSPHVTTSLRFATARFLSHFK